MKTTRKLPVQLTPEEKEARGDAMAESVQQKAILEEEKKSYNSEMKGKIEAAQSITTRLAKIIRDGEEIRDVECDVRHDYKHRSVTIIRCDTGELIEERPMTSEELQLDLLKSKEQRSREEQEANVKPLAKGKGEKLPGAGKNTKTKKSEKDEDEK